MNNNGYFHYPDGTDKDQAPMDGEICRVQSHKRGKFTEYEWNEEANEWIVLPTNRTPLEVIEKAKEILKIGKFSHLRPARRRSYYDYEDTMGELYPYATAAVRDVIDIDPLTGVARLDERDPVSCFQASATHITNHTPGFIPCHCGASSVSGQTEHYRWCPRHPHYSD